MLFSALACRLTHDADWGYFFSLGLLKAVAEILDPVLGDLHDQSETSGDGRGIQTPKTCGVARSAIRQIFAPAVSSDRSRKKLFTSQNSH